MINNLLPTQNAIDWDELVSAQDDRECNFSEDPLTLGCAIKHVLEKEKTFMTFGDDRLLNYVNDDIKSQAEKIRKYYCQKYFWSKLKNNRPINPFRERVLYLLESRTLVAKEKDKGIYYKLPWFYEEDMIYEEFKKNYQTADIPTISYWNISKPPIKKTLDLTYLKSTISTQSKRKIERFWFTDQTYLYGIAVDQNNPLIDMFKGLLESGKNIKFDSLYQVDNIDRLYYYKLYNFNLTKESNA